MGFGASLHSMAKGYYVSSQFVNGTIALLSRQQMTLFQKVDKLIDLFLCLR